MLNRIIKRYSIITVIVIFLSGCGTSLFSHRNDNPVIQDVYLAPQIWPWNNKTLVNTFATTASRRLVITKQDNYGDTIEICAEAPPDVGEAFASAISNGFKLAITEKKTDISTEALNNYARSVATQITPLVYRSQGLQFFRDAMYNLCLDRMNLKQEKNTISKIRFPLTTTKITTTSTVDKVTGKMITETIENTTIDSYQEIEIDVNNYNAMKAFYIVQALEMIKKELPIMSQVQQNFFQSSKTGFSIDDLNKIANIVKDQSINSNSANPKNEQVSEKSDVAK